jgi:PAS domain S-box-containing protein
MNDKDLLHLAAIVRDSDDAILGETLDGIITSWNVGAERIYGYTAEEAIGRTVAMLVPPDREDELPDILEKLTRGEGINHYDTLRVTKDGRLVNVSLTISPLHDASGAITGASSIGREVTKEKEAEAALRESARAYKLLMEQASDAILVSYPDQPLIEVNQRASDMLGYTRDELLQLSGGGSALPEDVTELPLRLDEIHEGDILSAERSMRRKDGTVIITEISTRRLDDGRIVTIARDITDRKRAEEALRESEARLRSAIDIAQLTFYEWNPQTDALTWDVGLKRIWDLPPDTSIDNEIFLTGVHPDDRESVQAAITRSSDPSGDGLYTSEYRVIGQQDKQERWIAARGKTLFEDNIAVHHVGVVQDITERKRAEEALATSEANLRALFAAMRDVVLVLDAQGRYLQIAPTNPDLLYKPAAELLGRTIHEVLPAAHADNILHLIRQALETQEPVHIEYSLPIGESEIWFDGTVSPMGEDKVFWIARDITKRKRADENLRESEERFRLMFANSPLPMWVYDVESLQFLEVNEAAMVRYGYSRDEFLSMRITNLQPAEEIARLMEDLEQARLALKSSGEWRHQKKDGEIIDVQITSHTFQFGERSKDAILVVAEDITERKRAEEALRASEEKFRAIFENTLDAEFITDDKGRFVDVNHAASELIGLPAEELVGHSYAEFQNWKSATELGRLHDQVAERGEASGDLQFVGVNGETRDVEYSSKANFIPGYHLSVAHDLTERRRKEEARMARDAAERANRAKSEFLSRMSHELRTPLNAILGFGQLLQMDTTTPDQEESVEYIIKAGRHLLKLVDEVLDIARIEEGKLAISIEPVLIRDVLQESLDLVQTLAAHRNIELNANLTWLDNCYVMADRQMLQQVLLNLLANAIKYNREGGVVNISCSELSSELHYEADGVRGGQDPAAPESPQLPARVRIVVSDTGHGLPPDKMARLFTPFERLGAEHGDVEGTGLGLALSKHLVKAMGGSIGVESEQGIGSTFWIELSRADEHMPGLELLVTGPLYSFQLDEQSRTMLYIEDNLSNLRLVDRILKKWPEINLITAMQGQMGLDMAYEHRPDLILLDLHLPDMTGNEVLRRLREDPRTASIPVVVLSADANPRHVEKLIEAGAQAYLTKPLDVKQLLKVLGETVTRTAD